MTGAVGWRKDNLKYKKNEVFLDIVEQVNMLMSSQGAVLRCDVNGKVVMKVFLSGMPDVKLGLNDALEVSLQSEQPYASSLSQVAAASMHGSNVLPAAARRLPSVCRSAGQLVAHGGSRPVRCRM